MTCICGHEGFGHDLDCMAVIEFPYFGEHGEVINVITQKCPCSGYIERRSDNQHVDEVRGVDKK